MIIKIKLKSNKYLKKALNIKITMISKVFSIIKIIWWHLQVIKIHKKKIDLLDLHSHWMLILNLKKSKKIKIKRLNWMF